MMPFWGRAITFYFFLVEYECVDLLDRTAPLLDKQKARLQKEAPTSPLLQTPMPQLVLVTNTGISFFCSADF
jgi:hypothetical protein